MGNALSPELAGGRRLLRRQRRRRRWRGNVTRRKGGDFRWLQGKTISQTTYTPSCSIIGSVHDDVVLLSLLKYRGAHTTTYNIIYARVHIRYILYRVSSRNRHRPFYYIFRWRPVGITLTYPPNPHQQLDSFINILFLYYLWNLLEFAWIRFHWYSRHNNMWHRAFPSPGDLWKTPENIIIQIFNAYSYYDLLFNILCDHRDIFSKSIPTEKLLFFGRV